MTTWLRAGLLGLFLLLTLPTLQTLWTANQAGILLNQYLAGGDSQNLERAAALLEARAAQSEDSWNQGFKDSAFWRAYGSAAARNPTEEAFLRLLEARNDGRLDRIGQLWLGEVASATGHWGEAHDAYVRLDAVNLLIQRGAEAQKRGDKAAGRNWYTLAAAGVMAAGKEDAASRIGRLSTTAPHEGDLLAAPGGRAISLLRIGRGFTSLGYPEEAVPVLEQAMSEMQADPPGLMERQSIHLSLADALAKVHPPRRPIDAATKARIEHLVEEGLVLGRSGSTLLTAGAVMWAAGNKMDALELNREAVRGNPRLPEAYLSLGAVYHSLSYPYLALDLYRKAVRQVPDDPRLVSELGKTTLQTTGPSQAVPILERARDMDPDNVTLLTSLGDAYLAVGRAREAMRAYREGLSLVPDSKVLEKKIHQAAQARRTLA